MKLTIIIILIILSSFSLFGNDGVYLSSGGVIYPTNETKISLDREILSFKVIDNICTVNILFEFNNPEKNARKLLIGFQAPSAAGDATDEVCNNSQISDFKIFSNGMIIPYKLKKAECEDCELKETKDLYFTQEESGVFVYLFEYTFKSGINRINQSYSFPASSNADVEQTYYYILKTGAKWAGGMIKHLSVQIDYGDNKYFYVNDIFGKNADWSIIGTGKITNEKYYDYDSSATKMVRVLSGKLQIDVTNFKPENNIEFGIINRNFFFIFPLDKITEMIYYLQLNLTLENDFLFKDLSKEDLKLIRNMIYAQHGYNFKDKKLQDYFSKYEWYIADPNLSLEQIKFSEKQKKFLDKISKLEKEKK